ncbi:hypothetical protein [Fimbriiglobus ruber]|uniref:OrfE protein n=1 Tax=Fimbriiglobus ruber TaxID=1908690 RepID=A0A225E0Q3_9BACT|nr:hypothetical protein [Fimbriiglobus ruber]OWK44388.1 OrfE protein [Fimbriiglobus ruber]
MLAAARYHDLLATGSAAADSAAALDRLQELCGVTFDGRPLCTVLRPRFLTPEQYRFVRQRVADVLPAFRAVHTRAIEDPAFRVQLRTRAWENELLALDPGFPDPSPTSRLDAFLTDDGRGGHDLKFTEYNTETPAGAGYSDALAEIFHGLPVFQDFQRLYHTLPIPCQPGVFHALLDAYRKWRGANPEPPRIAIMDWREVPTFSEFVLFYDYFRSFGLEVRNVDPRDVHYARGKLMAGDYHITLIYKRVLINELVDRGGHDHPVIRAVRDGAVCMVNPFRCRVLFKKASLAVVTDERNADMFTAVQQRAIAAHIPWTRVVEERKTLLSGETIDLVPYILAHQDRLVLKPNDSYGGSGIVLGWTVPQGVWEAAVQLALNEPFVVQERIAIPSEPYPVWRDGGVTIEDRMLDTNPYVAFNTYAHGCLTRLSTGELINVSAGGGSTVPTFLIEER